MFFLSFFPYEAQNIPAFEDALSPFLCSAPFSSGMLSRTFKELARNFSGMTLSSGSGPSLKD